jgi:hypothetical protein
VHCKLNIEYSGFLLIIVMSLHALDAPHMIVHCPSQVMVADSQDFDPSQLMKHGSPTHFISKCLHSRSPQVRDVSVGAGVGFLVGLTDGSSVGSFVGCHVGSGVGEPLGRSVGLTVGELVSLIPPQSHKHK